MMSEPGHTRASRRLVWIGFVAVAALVVLACVGFGLMRLRQASLEHRLLAAMPEDVLTHKDLVDYAVKQARPLFAANCASCHGADMKGRPAAGAPNLTDGIWLYGDGSVFRIERTILYGIRSEQKKSANITEMPAYGLRGQLSEGDINSVVQYLLLLSGRPHDAQTAELGKAVFAGRGGCGDCHGGDAKGNSDYGAPDLTANVWNHGGDPRDIYNSIYYGRHGTMPAWINKLTLEQIRALAVYVHTASHG